MQPKTCRTCPLRMEEPVLSESHDDDRVILLGEAPALHETFEGRPFVGPGGIELQRALNSLDIRRDQCYLANAIRCRPPKNDLEAMNIAVSRRNRKREKKAKEEKTEAVLLKRPGDACKSLLYEELAATGITKIICLGKWAAKASLMASYADYSRNAYDKSIFGLERHINNYPADKNIPYAHYLIAMCHYEQILDEKKI